MPGVEFDVVAVVAEAAAFEVVAFVLAGGSVVAAAVVVPSVEPRGAWVVRGLAVVEVLAVAEAASVELVFFPVQVVSVMTDELLVDCVIAAQQLTLIVIVLLGCGSAVVDQNVHCVSSAL